MLPTFLQNVTLQEAFETATPDNGRKRIEFDGAFCKAMKKKSNF